MRTGRWTLLVTAMALLPAALAGCDDAETTDATSSASSTSSAVSSSSGMPMCPAECPGDQSCHDGVCEDPTAEQLSQVATLETYVDDTVARSAWPVAIDGAALKAAGRAAILHGDRSDAAFFQAMHRAHLGLPQGHQTLQIASAGACDTPAMYTANTSRFGVCGRPLGDAIVVTFARPGNPLGLSAGDTIVRAGEDAGPGLLDAAIDRPICGSLAVSPSGKRSFAAASFFGTVPPGMVLTVHPADGSADHDVTVPDTDGETISCQDPLGRDIEFNASAYVRPDGVAVIRLPRFYPNDATLPPNPTQMEFDQFVDDFRQKIVAVFDQVKSAPAIVWDARSNYGGITLIGLEIAAGMPTATATNISYCNSRIAKSDPPAFSATDYAVYDIAPGGPFAYSGKVVVLVDGLDYSAADYFPYAVHKATSTPIVGTATAGAFGGPGPLKNLVGPPAMQYDIDVNRCVDADTDAPLEGAPLMPDVVVEYAPADLESGVDTVLEAAVALVK